MTHLRGEDPGWRVLRFWEHEATHDIADVVIGSLPPRTRASQGSPTDSN